ncbi:DnaT-like ssDNA-binding domain-containing protein [Pseudomonas sp. TMP25]|uniref:DnaT-like ssDNA-binding domain-containing protein n=1 Tax=Pseudomonas sp. TMP25 TaxID=3136561 RepID=UPI003100C649
MKRPSFQFYPADWRNNAKLRRCSWEARGVWIELLGLLHDSDNYGVLAWPLKEIAQALGAPLKALKELVDKGVLYGIEKGVYEPFIYTPRSGRKDGEPLTLLPAQQGPLWFSPRMVRDEYVRTVRGESTRFGDGDSPKKKAPKHSPKGGLGADIGAAPSQRQGDGSTSSSTSTSTTTAPNGASVEARQRFEMHLDWQPDELNLKAQCRAMAVSPDDLTATLVDEFRAYWVNRDTADSQGGWCHRLVKSAKGQLARAAANPASTTAGADDDWAGQGVRL